jgi:hypothetical protein
MHAVHTELVALVQVTCDAQLLIGVHARQALLAGLFL